MSSEEERKVKLRKKIEYQVACEERAFRIVEQLIENPITEQQLLDALQFITPNHYSDIVEERAVSKLCGYPICGKTLSNVPKQKYAISTKTNKVYDIEGKKNFCSGRCYKASLYLQKQIATSPVWSRQKQPPIKFELLPLDGKSGYVGDEVVLSQREEMKHDLAKLEKLDKYQDALRKRRLAEEPPKDETKAVKEKVVSESEAKFEAKAVDFDGKKDDAENTGKCKDIGDRKHENSKSLADGQHAAEKDDPCVYTLERALDEMIIGTEIIDTKIDRSDAETDLEQTEYRENLDKTSKDTGQNDDKDHQGNKEIDADSIKKEATIIKKVNLKEQAVEHKAIGQNVKPGPNPGESKSDYLMRLLDKRKSLLAKMADIQPLSAEGQDNVQGANKVLNSDNDSMSVNPIQPSVIVSNKRPGAEEDQAKSLIEDNNIDKVTILDRTKVIDIKIVPKSAGNVAGSEIHSHKISKSGKSKEKFTTGKRTSLVEKKVSSTEIEKQMVSTLLLICKTIQAWITVESLEYLKRIETEEPDPGKTEFERQYKALERKIDQQERDFDNMLGEEMMGDDDPMDGPSGPLPHFEVLKKEVEDDTVRVHQFLKGSFTYKVEERETSKTIDKGQEVILPSVDRYDQMLIRQRIVLERISKVLPGLLTPLHLLVQHVFTELRELVFTFNLTKDNILFKPAEWMVVSLVLLKLISCKNTSIRAAFGTQEAEKYVNIVLRGAGSNVKELENCVVELAESS